MRASFGSRPTITEGLGVFEKRNSGEGPVIYPFLCRRRRGGRAARKGYMEVESAEKKKKKKQLGLDSHARMYDEDEYN